MPINCLTDYVTLSRVCSPDTPGSGLYLDEQFSIIRITRLASLTDTVNKSADELMDALVTRATRALEDDVRAQMEGQFTRTDVVTGITSHEYEEPFELTTVGVERRGVYIEASESPYIDINIEEIGFYAVSGGPGIVISIYDANSGNLLDTINTGTLSLGYNRVQINKTYSTGGRTRRLFVCYDATAIQSAKTDNLIGWGDSCYCDCAGQANDFVSIRGASVSTSSSVIESNLTKGGNSFGLIVVANIECSIGAFVCKHKAGFRSAYLHRLLIEFLLEIKYSDRINEVTIYNDREQINDELNGIDNNPGLYDQYYTMIKRAISQIEPADRICFECDEETIMVSTIP